MLGLSIRQPYAELILRGDQGGGASLSGGFPPSYSTLGGDRIIGRRFYIYAAGKPDYFRFRPANRRSTSAGVR
jgi:hypothetical protein